MWLSFILPSLLQVPEKGNREREREREGGGEREL